MATEGQDVSPLDLDSIMTAHLTYQGDEASSAPAPPAPAAPTTTAPAPAAAEPEGEVQLPAGVVIEPPPSPAEPPSPRFKDHAAAETGYRHLQDQYIKTATELNGLKARLDSLESDKKQAADQVEQERAEQERQEAAAKMRAEVVSFGTAKNKEALAAIAQLDPDDAQYNDRVAEIWATTNQAISEHQAGLQPPAQPEAPPPAPATVAPPPAAPAIEAPAAPDYTAERLYIDGQCQAAGFAESDPVFRHYAQESAKLLTEGQQVSFQEQVTWAIAQTTKYKATQRDQVLQEVSMPLGQGGRLPVGGPAGGDPGPARPLTMSDALDSAMESRRV